MKINETLELLYHRKSVRAYEERRISEEEKAAILEAARQAPTAGNMTLYTILDITDQAKKERLAVTCDNQPFIAKAPMVLIFCADYRRWYDIFCKYEGTVRKPAEGDLFLAQADALIAAQSAVVAAESLGIGSCYIGDITENYEIHRELLQLPRYVVPACMLCFGYPTDQQRERQKPARFPLEDIVCENTYKKKDLPAMERMITAQHGEWKNENLIDWVKRFCARKWNSAFSEEMSRSCKAMVEDWNGGMQQRETVAIEYCNLPMDKAFENEELREEVEEILQDAGLDRKYLCKCRRTFEQFVVLGRGEKIPPKECHLIYKAMEAQDRKKPYPLTRMYPYLKDLTWRLEMADVSYLRVDVKLALDRYFNLSEIRRENCDASFAPVLYLYPENEEPDLGFFVQEGRKVLRIYPESETVLQEMMKSILLKGTLDLDKFAVRMD